MLETFVATIKPMIVMFLCIAVGFIMKRKNLIPDNADVVISKLELYVCCPALTISTYISNCTVQSLGEQAVNILYCLLLLAIAIPLAMFLSRFFAPKGSYQQNIYKYAMAFSNYGFMGNAIVPAILGHTDSAILYKYQMFTFPLGVAIYLWGLYILVPKGNEVRNPLKNLINPGTISVLIGAVLGLTGAKGYTPDFVMTALDYCKACMAPLAMILTGITIGKYSIRNMLSDKKVYIATGLRLLVLPAFFVGLMMLLGAPKIVLILTLFAFGTPLGLNTVVFPAAYGGETKTGASMAAISHTICVVTIPLLYALLTMIIG
ncbi:MAG: AEC family transporter [Clostridia bacterium]|nr:AEC family transporter [Clostridia bacterium]